MRITTWSRCSIKNLAKFRTVKSNWHKLCWTSVKKFRKWNKWLAEFLLFSNGNHWWNNKKNSSFWVILLDFWQITVYSQLCSLHIQFRQQQQGFPSWWFFSLLWVQFNKWADFRIFQVRKLSWRSRWKRFLLCLWVFFIWINFIFTWVRW
jgi:hypothetical protein